MPVPAPANWSARCELCGAPIIQLKTSRTGHFCHQCRSARKLVRAGKPISVEVMRRRFYGRVLLRKLPTSEEAARGGGPW